MPPCRLGGGFHATNTPARHYQEQALMGYTR